MREGSYALIEKGMKVVGPDGETIGAVDQVIEDTGSGIFVGLAVKPNLFTHALLVHGEDVDRLHDGVVYVDRTAQELRPYDTPEEKQHDAAEAYNRLERAG